MAQFIHAAMRGVSSQDHLLTPDSSDNPLVQTRRYLSAITLPNHVRWAPHSEPTADKPSETKAFPQPSSAPSLCTTGSNASINGVRHD